jgi:hypothetical protein
MEKENSETLSFKIPCSLRRLLAKYLELDTHMNESDFCRDAIREKIKRDAPQLYKQLFQQKEKEQP